MDILYVITGQLCIKHESVLNFNLIHWCHSFIFFSRVYTVGIYSFTATFLMSFLSIPCSLWHTHRSVVSMVLYCDKF